MRLICFIVPGMCARDNASIIGCTLPRRKNVIGARRVLKESGMFLRVEGERERDNLTSAYMRCIYAAIGSSHLFQVSDSTMPSRDT